MNKRHLYALSILLTVTGCTVFIFKVFALGFPLTAFSQQETWNIEASINFEPVNKPVKVSLFIPTGRNLTIIDESFISRGYGLQTKREGDNRWALWSIRKPKGMQTLYYRATVQTLKPRKPGPSKKTPQVQPPDFEGPYLEAANHLLAGLQAESADLDTLVAGLFQHFNRENLDNNSALLLGKKPTLTKKLELAVDILALNQMAARIAHGVYLEEFRKKAPVVHWLQVYTGAAWQDYNPKTGEPAIYENQLFWWHGREPLARLSVGKALDISISITRNLESAISATIERGEILAPQLLQFSSFFSLPLETQAVYRVLLLIPLGAFLLVICRNVVGIKTFGTFMPVLLALAFRETGLFWGVVMLCLMVTIGLNVRFFLEHLKLLLVPRLASLLIIVVLLMAGLSILTHKLGLERGLSVALFPMVIITMTIERMTIVWEELGPLEALKQGAGSLLVAILAYAVMVNRYVEHIVFVFPETLLILLAGTLLLGRYSGYRLTELYRFKAFAGKKG